MIATVEGKQMRIVLLALVTTLAVGCKDTNKSSQTETGGQKQVTPEVDGPQEPEYGDPAFGEACDPAIRYRSDRCPDGWGVCLRCTAGVWTLGEQCEAQGALETEKEFDDKGRPVRQSHTGSLNSMTHWFYGAEDVDLELAAHVSREKGVDSARTTAIGYEMDATGRPVALREWPGLDGTSVDESIAYGANGEVQTVTGKIPEEGYSINFQYDSEGRLSKVTLENSSGEHSQQYVVNPSPVVGSSEMGTRTLVRGKLPLAGPGVDALSRWLPFERMYDGDHWLTDNQGRVTEAKYTQVDLPSGDESQQVRVTDIYTYDYGDDGRLVGGTIKRTSATTAGTMRYEFDYAGSPIAMPSTVKVHMPGREPAMLTYEPKKLAKTLRHETASYECWKDLRSKAPVAEKAPSWIPPRPLESAGVAEFERISPYATLSSLIELGKPIEKPE